MENLSGHVVKSYQMLERVGTGGFGAVYRAIQPNVDREVAIKVILSHHANHPDFVKRFETEAQLVARLEHPHIIPLYDYWREPNSAYLVMRFLRGGSLRQSIEKEGAWSLRRTVAMVTQIGAALTFAHQHGVVHRDLKSDNIMLDESGNSYLGDFGIAKDLGANSDLTKDALLGTPAYLAPEQIRGETASPHSDNYALGILTFEVLTGTKPFHDLTPATVLYKQLNEIIPDIRTLRPELPEELNVILQRATAKDSDSRYATAIDFARSLYAVAHGADSGDLVPEVITSARSLISITDAENQVFTPQNPYKGLRAFQQSDTNEFYGRDDLVQSIMDRLTEDNELARFLAIIGPSGSGKSSVAKAGIVPRIKQGDLHPDKDWYVAEMVPGTHPFEELEAALLSIATKEMPGLLDQLREDERGLVRAVRRILPNDDAEFVLLIDQFEEVFTLVEDEPRREKFLNLLQVAARDVRSRLRILITLRADFYDRPLLYTGFGELIRRRSEVVLPLAMDELEAAIIEPARRVGVTIENGLIPAIVSDVIQQPGALPLLQYALTELFERREGRVMTLAAYEKIGGTSGALAQRAEEVYQSFDATKQGITRQIMLRLVALGEGTEDTRRRIFQSELLSIGKDRESIKSVLDTFGRFRLLTFDHDPQTRSSTVEVAHEALIRRWDRLREWLDEDREGLRLQRRLNSLSQEWLQSNRDRSFLARGGRLQQLENWVQSSDISLSETESEFLQASIAEREHQQTIERERVEREARLEARARSRLRILAVVMSVAALISGGLAILAINTQQEAVQAREVAEEQAIIAEANAQEAQALAVAANVRNALTANDSQLALSLALTASEEYADDARIPLELQRVMAASAYAPGPTAYFDEHSGTVLSVDLSSDGQMGVSSSMDGTLRLWEVDSRAAGQVITPAGDALFIPSVQFSPSGDQIAAGFSDGTVRVYSVADGDELLTIPAHDDVVMSLAYSNDGAWIASGGLDRVARVWSAETGEEVFTFDDYIGGVLRVTFTPDDSRLVTTTADETILDTGADQRDRVVKVWNLQTGTSLTIRPESGFVRAVTVAPDGASVAVGLWDGDNGGTIRLYSLTNGLELGRMFGHNTPITDLRYTSDGTRLISSAWDRTILLWDVERRIELSRFVGFDDRIMSFDLSSDDSMLIIGLGNGGDNELVKENDLAVNPAVILWTLRSGDQIHVLEGHDDWLWTADISPDGSMIATGGGPLNSAELIAGEDAVISDHSVRLWSTETGEQIAILRAHSATVDSVQFHPDGQHLLTSSWDHLMILWDIETREPIRFYRDFSGRVYDVNFTADGTRFVSAGGGSDDENVAILWDTETGDILRTYTGFEGSVNSAVFSPDETTLLTGSGDRVIRLFDVETGELLQTFNGHTSSVNEVRFTPDGTRFASTAWDDTVRLWDVATGEEIRQFTGHTNNTFGIDFSSDGEILLTTSTDQTVRMWSVSTGDELQRFDIHTDWVQEVVLSPDETFAVSAAQDGTAKVIRILRDADEIAGFARENRSVRALSCAERDLYRLNPCDV